jgi:hypothetical protein
MENKIKPCYGVIWSGLKGLYISAQGNALGIWYFRSNPVRA